jgi:valyl-tRNA synthetase
MASERSSRFDPLEIEPKWEEFWERHGLFRAPARKGPGEHHTFVLPPPNLTGILTVGHALGDTCQDILVRYYRMGGAPTLWVPGVDHAGLATQIAVRRHLESQGVDVRSLSREDLLREIEKWRAEKEPYIRRQMVRLGLSLDWSRYTYTLEPRYARAVRRAFRDLYRKGLIYRAERMVNWDPQIQTALSDLEVIPRTVTGTLWHIRYPGEPQGPDPDGLVVATTRPETLFGDVAVAVHPDDARYRARVGQRVQLPLTDRWVPVIADSAVDPEFGEGALKVTPSHDMTDHQIAGRHPELPSRRDVLDAQARLFGPFVPDRFQGLDRFAARREVVAALKREGFLVREETYVHNVGYSERSEVPVEPRLSLQWWVNVRELGPRALEAVRQGQVRIYPEEWTRTYFHFMENLQDWCISRQVIWGHPIPVWSCVACSATDVYEEEPPSQCPSCSRPGVKTETDVLDTWFSSWLWPFATLGWPEKTDDLNAYFPVEVLVTGSDILFFWVARMIMAGLEFLGEVPFPRVYLTGILRDAQNRKLSKHLGNSPDPLEIVARWGADPLRFGLVFPNPTDVGGAWDQDRMLEISRHFLTKLWNVGRWVARGIPPEHPPAEEPWPAPVRTWSARWILSRCARVIGVVDEDLRRLRITPAATEIYNFVWHELADWYLETAKEGLAGRHGDEERREQARVALFVLDRTLRLLHPFVPHVTEEIWQSLPHDGLSLAVAHWPVAPTSGRDPEAEALFGALQDLVRGVRTLRADVRIPPEARPRARVRPRTPEAERVLGSSELSGALVRLGRLQEVRLLGPEEGISPGTAAFVTPSAEIFLLGEASETSVEERQALLREIRRLEELLEKTRQRLADPTFQNRAPPPVVEATRGKEREIAERLQLLRQHAAVIPEVERPPET